MAQGRRDPLEGVDPAVAAILGDQERKQAIRRAPKKEGAKLRRKLEKEASERERQAGRNRVTLELDRVVVDVLRQVAGQEEVSPASACNWLLANALLQYARADLTFSGCKRVTTSPRWPFTVELGEVAGELGKLL